MKDVAAELGITGGMVRVWAAADKEFGALYARAREDQAHAIAEEALAIADGFDPDGGKRLQVMAGEIKDADDKDKARILDSLSTVAVQRDRIRVDTRKWLASKIAPREYGERQTVTHEGEVVLRRADQIRRGRERARAN